VEGRCIKGTEGEWERYRGGGGRAGGPGKGKRKKDSKATLCLVAHSANILTGNKTNRRRDAGEHEKGRERENRKRGQEPFGYEGKRGVKRHNPLTFVTLC